MNEFVRIVEVGPRDGLQNEPDTVSLEKKIEFINALSETGLSCIEAASFVSAKAVPQMAGSDEVMAGIARKKSISYSALVPNLAGYKRAREAGVDEVAVFASASESFSQKNINCSIAESLERFVPVVEAAKTDGTPVRGYISCVVKCPYEGDVSPDSTARLAGRLVEMGCYEISLGDTIGAGTPETIAKMLAAVTVHVEAKKLAGHYHDTGGKALDCVLASLDAGLRTFDASAAGLGGCPFAPGAPGNLATGALVAMLHAKGYETGVDAAKLAAAEHIARGIKAQ